MCVNMHDCKDHGFCSDPRCILCISSFCHIFPHSGDQISSMASSACNLGKLLWNKGEFCKLILFPQNGWVWLHFLSSCLVWHQSTVSSYRGHNLSLKHLKYQELIRICVILSPFLKEMLLWREEVDGRVTERLFGGQMRFIGLSLSMTTNDLSSSGGFTN